MKINTIERLALATIGATSITLGSIGTTLAATLIDTTPSWNGTSSVTAIGAPNNATATYGQTFTVGSDNILNDFSFWVKDDLAPGLTFGAYVMAWDGDKATGSALYQSAPQTANNPLSFQKFTFNTGGVTLAAGQKYVAFLNTSNFPTNNGAGSVGFVGPQYAGGEFVNTDNGTNFGSLTTTAWDCGSNNINSCFGGADLAFTANFSANAQAVPEPFTIIGTVIGGTVALRMRKKLKDTDNS
jgi:hypothetical protein